MEPDEEWPFKVFNGKKYMWGPDNGCFYRWSTMRFGVCVGPVDQKDRFGNKYCHHHLKVALKAEKKASKQ